MPNHRPVLSLATGDGPPPTPLLRGSEPSRLPVSVGGGPAADPPGGAIARVASALPALVPEDYERPVSAREAIAVLAKLSMETGWTATPERRAAIANALVREGYTRAAVELAGQDLAVDPVLARTLSYQHGTVSPADFARMIKGDGKAARTAGLLTHPQMLQRFEELGGGGQKLRTGDLFETVELDGKTYFRER